MKESQLKPRVIEKLELAVVLNAEEKRKRIWAK